MLRMISQSMSRVSHPSLSVGAVLAFTSERVKSSTALNLGCPSLSTPDSTSAENGHTYDILCENHNVTLSDAEARRQRELLHVVFAQRNRHGHTSFLCVLNGLGPEHRRILVLLQTLEDITDPAQNAYAYNME